ncbi:hypothetical protein LCGC14_2789700 [marine sediment metagenome]|uniref:Uncharacterized protein n=1 Tax=marine sediment metagenome TaxID=412755 RepID=A0A0F8ZCY5_9ZZZZ
MATITTTTTPSRLPCGGTPYESVAQLLSKHHVSPGMCYDFEELFANNNPDFNRPAFLAACGLVVEPMSDEDGYRTHEHNKDFPECYGLESEG